MKTENVKTLFLILILSLSASLVTSCGGDKKEPDFRVSQEVFATFVNSGAMPSDVDQNKDVSFLNRDYPIELSLYENGEWFYDLPNLGTGRGTYKYEDGILKLTASRDIFDIYIELASANAEGSAFTISFRDRFGYKVLATEITNKN